MCSSLIMFIQTSFYMPSKYSPSTDEQILNNNKCFYFSFVCIFKKHFYYHSKLCCFITKDVSKQENIEIKLFIHCPIFILLKLMLYVIRDSPCVSDLISPMQQMNAFTLLRQNSNFNGRYREAIR